MPTRSLIRKSYLSISMAVVSLLGLLAQSTGFSQTPAKERKPEVSVTEEQSSQKRAAQKQELVNKLPAGTRTFFDVPYLPGVEPVHSPDSIQTLDLYVPAGSGPFPLIIWIHGGGWNAGDKEVAGASFALRFGAQGFAVASLNYRFARDHAFPAQIEDCEAALVWLRSHAAEYKIDAERIGVIGHSAGGHLAALMAFTGDGSTFNKNPSASTRVQAAVLWACPSDLTRTSGGWSPSNFVWKSNDQFVKTFFPGGEYDEGFAAKASPITYVHAGVPPVLMVHGAQDVVVPAVQSNALAQALKNAGVQVTLRIDPAHGHDVMQQEGYEEALSFFQRSLGVKGSDANKGTMLGKVFAGYQGWFAPAEVGGREQWRHYGNKGKFDSGSVVVDMWPEVSELDADERYPTPFRHADGRVAEVFSSANAKTVDRHFRWMKEYGIDGVFLQRFGVWLKDPDMKPFTDVVMENVRKGAAHHDRQWTVMYDLSVLQKGDIAKFIIPDWKRLVDEKKIRADRQFAQHNNKPLIAIWGVGFDDNRAYTLEECKELVSFLKNDPVYGGNAVMLGVPYWWRTLDRDCLHTPLVHELIEQADIVSPWAVGRHTTPVQALSRERDPLSQDAAWLAKRKLDYLPVAFPGFSWYNLEQATGTARGVFNQVPRLGGQFLWTQALAAKRAGSQMLYIAMFDEIDEGTAIMKVSQDPPVGKDPFLTYEGLPSDHYLWLTGQIGRLMRGEIPATDAIPKREQ